MDKDITVNIIYGPTASGKSSFAINEAIKNNGIIINADSQQVYKELPILTACPTTEDYTKVEHKLYQFIDGFIGIDVNLWLKNTVNEIINANNKGKIPFIVGGTGFYIKSLIEGLSPIPEINLNIRNKIREKYKNITTYEIYEDLKKIDIELANKLSKNDRQRILRGIEVFYSTGIKLSNWQKKEKIKLLPNAKFNLKFINPEMKILETRIKQRTEFMINNRVIDEVKTLLNKNYKPNSPIFKVIGVKSIINYINKNMNIDELQSKLILETRQYAKRQKTFFKNSIQNI